MNEKLNSYLRHAFTAWIATAVLFLTAKLTLDAEAVDAVRKALNQIGDGLLLLIITLAPVIGRMAWSWISNIFRKGSGENDAAGKSGGALPLLVLVCAAAALMGGLPSCSPAQLAAASRFPIRACVVTDQGTVCYSAKGGLSAEIDARSGK